MMGSVWQKRGRWKCYKQTTATQSEVCATVLFLPLLIVDQCMSAVSAIGIFAVAVAVAVVAADCFIRRKRIDFVWNRGLKSPRI